MENGAKSSEAKWLEELGMEQMITAPLVEAAKARIELRMDGVEKRQQPLASAVPQDEKQAP